ncbi:BTAD domain-containing putative transcriptional regulator [Polymorphospora rubra]|uniref:SARP family transcriptional regulator n=1 Tax=Polymorphospora rubra TaxID=338584 RepID=A0A810N6B5_9ACTN|nr:BTAD domain-containing putative transcriptional regulator [Polymorphospora rubra]BCJ68520.1 SARP family transcriptional regulator [Polymorphospora rubra]
MTVVFEVLGPVRAVGPTGDPLDLKGPRHREVLGRLVAADGRVVTVDGLVDDLWAVPPAGAVGSVRTFVATLRRALEPDRAPRTPSRLLVSRGNGYALRTSRDAVDAWRFEDAVEAARQAPARRAADDLDRALHWWQGPAYAEFPDAHWARTARRRLDELRLHAVELRAAAWLDLGRAAGAVPDLDALVTEHPGRERAWRLLALALYRDGRQGESLAVLRRARDTLVDRLGLDPGDDLRRLEVDVLNQARRLTTAPVHGPDQPWARATAQYERTVAAGSRTGLRSTVDLLRTLAVTGGENLVAAREQRLAAILAAERAGDPDLTARIIGAYDVPAVWSRSDDPAQARQVVDAARRTLAALGPAGPDPVRARLLTTIAIESRGTDDPAARRAAGEAERIARELGDPALLVFALNGVFLHTFEAGAAPRRDAIGVEIVDVASRHGLTTYEILGHLVRLQARAAVADLTGADAHATAAEKLAERHESPLVYVFTRWYRAMRAAATGDDPRTVAAAYRDAARPLPEAGMPGLEQGLLPLALLTLRLLHDRPAPTGPGPDYGPYEPWARPLVLLAGGDDARARALLRALPQPPPDHLLEVRWCLAGEAAVATGDRDLARRAHAALEPAAGEHVGAGSGLLTLGPTARWLDRLARTATA